MSLHALTPQEPAKASFTWQDRLELCSMEAEVVNVARDFVATLAPEEIALLDPICRPRKFTDASDITSYAFELVRHECADTDPGRELVHKLAAFFSHASTRLSQVMARSAADEDDSLESA